MFQFLKCALEKFPAMLGFDGGAEKGFFAWRLADRCRTLDYIGPLPEAYLFGVDKMDSKKLARFWAWYLSWPPGKLYNMREEAIKYCE